MIVVDTNVIAYLLIPGNASAAAEQVIRKDPAWAAPPLWRSEMRNLLALYLRRNVMTLDEVRNEMERAERVVGGRRYEIHSSRVLELSGVSGCTAYDCEFVYLAEALGVPLVTEDQKVLFAFPGQAIAMADFLA